MSSFPYIFLFSRTLILRTFIAISASHWLIIWIALELNILSFIPLIIFSSWHQETEASIKYFLFQALGSRLLLLGSYSSEAFVLIFIGIIVKLGIAPFHFWFPSVINSISWPMCLLLATWQKIVPLLVLILTASSIQSSFIFLLASLNALVGGIGGLNQTQIRPLLAYSSVGHIGWILAASAVSSSIRITYFCIYIITSGTLFLYLFFLNASSRKSISSTISSDMFSLIILTLLLLSLGGLPPLTGFIPKWLVISSFQTLITPFILILGSLINLFYYLNICLSSALRKSSPIFYSKPNLSIFPLFIVSTLALPIILIYALILLN